MSSYILPLAFTQLRSTNRAVCSDPDLDDGDVTRIPPGHFLFRSWRWWRYLGFPRADRGLIPVQIEAMMTFHGQMTSSQQLYFRFHIYNCGHPPHCGPTCTSKRSKRSFFLKFEVSSFNFWSVIPFLQFLIFWSQDNEAEPPSHTTCAHRRNHINEHVKFRKLLTLILCM